MKKFFRFGRKKKSPSLDGSQHGGSDTSLCSLKGYTLKEKDLSKLHKASWSNDLAKVKQLAKKDSSPRDKYNRTPLHLAATRGHAKVVQELLEWRAKTTIGDNENRTPLMKAVECGRIECAEMLLESKSDPNSQDKEGEACLHYAAKEDNGDMLRLLLKYNATNPNITNNRGQTPLHIAVLFDNSASCDELLRYTHTKIDSPDNEGQTALMYACREGHKDICSMLLHNGADPTVKDAKGWRAEDMALMSSHEDCKQIVAHAALQRRGGAVQGHPQVASAAVRNTGPSSHVAGATDLFGAPALDITDDYSEIDITASKESEAAMALDSWADTDDDHSELDKKRSENSVMTKSLSPTIVEVNEENASDNEEASYEDNSAEDSDNIDVAEEEKPVPGINLAKMLKEHKEEDIDPSDGLSPPARLDGTPAMQATSPRGVVPTSARSETSVRSSLTFGDDKNWSDNDDDSLFSSSNKPKLPRLQEKAIEEDSDAELESWEEPVTTNKTDPAGNKTVDNQPKDFFGISADKQKDSQGKQDLMAELGLSDISEATDPAMSDGATSPEPPNPEYQLEVRDPANKTRPETNWATFGAENTPNLPEGNPPLSARSVESKWDSSCSEGNEDEKERENMHKVGYAAHEVENGDELQDNECQREDVDEEIEEIAIGMTDEKAETEAKDITSPDKMYSFTDQPVTTHQEKTDILDFSEDGCSSGDDDTREIKTVKENEMYQQLSQKPEDKSAVMTNNVLLMAGMDNQPDDPPSPPLLPPPPMFSSDSLQQEDDWDSESELSSHRSDGLKNKPFGYFPTTTTVEVYEDSVAPSTHQDTEVPPVMNNVTSQQPGLGEQTDQTRVEKDSREEPRGEQSKPDDVIVSASTEQQTQADMRVSTNSASEVEKTKDIKTPLSKSAGVPVEQQSEAGIPNVSSTVSPSEKPKQAEIKLLAEAPSTDEKELSTGVREIITNSTKDSSAELHASPPAINSEHAIVQKDVLKVSQTSVEKTVLDPVQELNTKQATDPAATAQSSAQIKISETDQTPVAMASNLQQETKMDTVPNEGLLAGDVPKSDEAPSQANDTTDFDSLLAANKLDTSAVSDVTLDSMLIANQSKCSTPKNFLQSLATPRIEEEDDIEEDRPGAKISYVKSGDILSTATDKQMPEEDEEEDSKWDSDIDLPLSSTREEKTPRVLGTMYERANEKAEDDEEEELESSWERENRLKRERQRAADKAKQESEKSTIDVERERSLKWEEEFQKRQEQLRKDAKKELQQEMDEQNKYRNSAVNDKHFGLGSDDDKEPEDEELNQEKWLDLKNYWGVSNGDAKEKQTELQPNKDTALKKPSEIRDNKRADNMQPKPNEKAGEERNTPWTPRANGDDEDTFHGLDITEMASPRKYAQYTPHDFYMHLHRPDFVPAGLANHLSGLPGVHHGREHQDEDGLSYSSTEHEGSVQEPLTPALSTSGDGHISLSLASDSITMMRLQEQLRESHRKLDKERNQKSTLENKKKSLERDRQELLEKLEDMTRTRSTLEKTKIDLEAKIRNLQFTMESEIEKKKNMETLYNKTKEQLARKEEQYTYEIEAKQRAELGIRNLQMEIRGYTTASKQLEEEKEDLQRQLNHEKNSRQLQEQINEEQLKFTQSLTEELTVSDNKNKAEELEDQLEEVDDDRKHALDNVEKLKAELYAVKMELERQQARSKEEHDLLSTENEDIHQKNEELKGDIKLNEEALAHASLKYNLDLSSLKTENMKILSTLDTEKSTKEKAQHELESLKNRLEATVRELDKAQEARIHLEKTNHRDHEEWNRVLEKREQEVAHLQELNQNLNQRVSDTDEKLNKIENELFIANATIVERTSQLQTLQKELEHRRHNQTSLDEHLRKEKESNVRLETKLQSLQERFGEVQQENTSLKEDLKQADCNKTQDSETLSVMLSSLRADQDKARQITEEKNVSLADQLARVKEELRSTDSHRSSLEQELRHLQQELTDTQKKLSVGDASLEIANKAKEQMQMEVNHLKSELDKLQTKLDESREKHIQGEARLAEATEKLGVAEMNKVSATEQLANQTGDLQAFVRSKGELGENLHKLEIQNTRLESALDHEAQKVEMLQKDLQEANNIRATLEGVISGLKIDNKNYETQLATQESLYSKVDELKTANVQLRYQLTEAAATRNIANQEAQDSRQLWETEILSKSKLGLRMGQLERQRQGDQTQLEEEKRKTRKALDMKKSADAKLEAEIEKSRHLEKDNATLKAHLKTTRKRLKELDTTDNRLNALRLEFEKERLETERTMAAANKQLEEGQQRLQGEVDNRDKMVQQMRQMKEELIALRDMEKSHAALEKNKRHLEEELQLYKSHVDQNYINKGELERRCQELEVKSRLELNQKLHSVNEYLMDQTKMRDRLDHMREASDSELRRDFEKIKRQLQDEITAVKQAHKETCDERDGHKLDAQKYKELFEAEQKQRERLASRLEKEKEKASLTQNFLEKQRLAATAQNGIIVPPSSLRKPNPELASSDALSHQMKQELNRSIAKHLEKGPQVDLTTPVLSSVDDSGLTSSFNKSCSEYMNVLHRNYLL